MASVVYSPDFPDPYATGRVCYWTIRVPGASHIHFTFTLFDIRDAADMVELLDGYTHRVLVRFNGRNRPPVSFNVSLDFVILYFFSDRINQAQGFAVLYQGETLLSVAPQPVTGGLGWLIVGRLVPEPPAPLGLITTLSLTPIPRCTVCSCFNVAIVVLPVTVFVGELKNN
jgi:hypothetical protein